MKFANDHRGADGRRGHIRRIFVAASASLLALGAVSCTTSGGAGAQLGTERGVTISMPEGSADALLFQPPSGRGPWPAVLVYTDISGLRPAYAEIGRALAAEGYVVLIPNAFYRSARLPGTHAAAALSPEQLRERTTTWTGAISDEAARRDAAAFMAYLDALGSVSADRKAAAIGYNYGAPYAFAAAAAVPERIGAVAAIHPFRIATARPNSPHLAVNQSKATYYVAIAQPDDEREPGDKDDLRKAFRDAGLSGAVEVVPAPQGFAVNDSPAYHPALAKAAQDRILSLLRASLD